MAHFARVLNGEVTQVIVAEPEFMENEFVDPNPAEEAEWIQCSYNTFGNVHYGPDGEPDDGVALRGNFPSPGFVYDSENDVFYESQPFASWTIDTDTWLWTPPIPCPIEKGKAHIWDEDTQSWVDLGQ